MNNAPQNKTGAGDILMTSTVTDGANDGKLWAVCSAGDYAPVIYGGDLYWTAGTIIVGNSDKGTSLISLSGTMIDDNAVAGNLCFEFNSDTFEFVGKSEYRIVSWDNITNKTDMKASDFKATGTLISALTGSFDAAFSVRNDGLYVSFVSVPEASTFAAFAGLAALAAAVFASRSRRVRR